MQAVYFFPRPQEELWARPPRHRGASEWHDCVALPSPRGSACGWGEGFLHFKQVTFSRVLPGEEQSSVWFTDRITLFSWYSVLLLSSHSKWKTHMHVFLQFRISQSCCWWAEDVICLVCSFIIHILSVCYVLSSVVSKDVCLYDLFRHHIFFSFSLSFPLSLVSHLSVCLNESACHWHFNFCYSHGQSCLMAWIVLSSYVVCLLFKAQYTDMSISKPLPKHLKLCIYLKAVYGSMHKWNYTSSTSTFQCTGLEPCFYCQTDNKLHFLFQPMMYTWVTMDVHWACACVSPAK